MAKAKNELDALREEVARLSGQARQALAKLERQAAANPELTFAKIAEILSAMPHVDDVLIQLQSHAHDYPCGTAPGTSGGVKQQGWLHEVTWRVFIRTYPEGKYADVTGPTCLAAIKAVLTQIKLPMPAGLEKLAKSLE